MNILFLGTGAAEGIPALFCQCEYCKEVRKRGGKEVRTRAQILIDGTLSIDFPPDAFTHMTNSGLDFSAIEHLLVTHSHMDHFYAHDFILRGYKYGEYMTAPTLHIYGNQEVKAVFEECTKREMRPDVEKNVKVHTVSAFTPFTAGACTVVALSASHTSQNPYLYLIEKGNKRYLHLTDTGILSEDVYEYLRGKRVDLVTLDCTFLWNEGEGVRRHMGVKDISVVLNRLAQIGAVTEATKKILTHFSHHSAPTPSSLARAERELGAVAAYDGFSLEI